MRGSSQETNGSKSAKASSCKTAGKIIGGVVSTVFILCCLMCCFHAFNGEERADCRAERNALRSEFDGYRARMEGEMETLRRTSSDDREQSRKDSQETANYMAYRNLENRALRDVLEAVKQGCDEKEAMQLPFVQTFLELRKSLYKEYYEKDLKDGTLSFPRLR